MKCPRCGNDAVILETRDHPDGRRRRYKCVEEHGFSTMEREAIFSRGGTSAWEWATQPDGHLTYEQGILQCIARLQVLADQVAGQGCV